MPGDSRDELVRQLQAKAFDLEQLNRIYAVVSGINALIARTRDANTILAGACQVAVAQRGLVMACALLRQDPDQPMRVAASAGAGPEALAVIERLCESPDGGCAFTARALATGLRATCDDIAHDPLALDWRAAALACGYRSMVTLPLTVGGRAVGVFNLYADVPGHFDADEERLLDELARDLSAALESCAREGERQRALEDLRESETRFRQLAETIREVFWLTDPEKQELLYISPGYEHIWGRSVASLAAAPREWLDGVHPDDRARVAAAARHQAHGGYDEEYRVVRPDGSVRWVRDRAFPIRDQKGVVYRIAGVAEDMTDRVQAEEALRSSEAGKRAVWESVMDGILTMDRDGRLTDINPAAERLFGLSRAAVTGRPMAEVVIPPAHREHHTRGLARYRATGQSTMLGRRLELQAMHADGHEFAVELTVVPVGHGDAEYFIGTVRDITQRLETEATLRQMQKLDSIGHLAAGVAHDFNNILTVQQGYLSMLLMDRHLPPDLAESLQQIAAAADRAAALTRQLLLFSRKQVMQRRRLGLNEVVGPLGRMLERLLGEHIVVRMVLDERLPIVNADPGMIEQVLMNLAVNARDAMPGGGRIAITTSRVHLDESAAARNPEARPGTFACLAVGDTGVGIPDAMLAHIFEPFYTTKDVGKGTGLGLATVHGIVKQHEGWVEVESEAGHGAMFRVFLPGVEGDREQVEAPARAIEPDGGHETILVVEDEAPLCRVVRVILERQGYRVLTAATGEEALRVWQAQNGAVDLLLTDLVMPGGMTGRQLAERLHDQRPDLRVVFTSGYSPDLAGRGLAVTERTTFLQKPYLPQQLASAVRALLDRA